MTCPVAGNCRDTTRCPFCVGGSEYQPIDRRIPFPAVAERREARRLARLEHRASAAYRRGKRSQRKGPRLERELARLVGGRRVPMSGALDGLPNDVVARNGWRLESKGRADGFGLIYRWLGEAEVVAMREPEGEAPWLFACRLGWMTARLADDQPEGDGEAVVRAVEGVRGLVALPGGVRCAVRRTDSLTLVRRWLTAESADALCVRRDRAGWVAVMDAGHLAALLAAREAAWADDGG
jgi:hypothetical protein